FFTRLLTKTGELELYRVRPDGQGLTRIGLSTPAWRIAGVDRSALLEWSPDASQIFFQGIDQQQARMVIYKALYDGSNPQELVSEPGSGSEFPVVRWLPTSRALLVGSQSRGMFLRWVDQDRPIKAFPAGF